MNIVLVNLDQLPSFDLWLPPWGNLEKTNNDKPFIIWKFKVPFSRCELLGYVVKQRHEFRLDFIAIVSTVLALEHLTDQLDKFLYNETLRGALDQTLLLDKSNRIDARQARNFWRFIFWVS